MSITIDYARQMRKVMEILSTFGSDELILQAPEICPYWKIGENVQVGDRRFYKETQKLYKVLIAHTTQESWTPDLTPALWAVVALNEEEGTIENPILAARGMEYTYGLYYRDPDDNQIYLCNRNGEPAGGTVILQYLPHELVGLYFQSV